MSFSRIPIFICAIYPCPAEELITISGESICRFDFSCFINCQFLNICCSANRIGCYYFIIAKVRIPPDMSWLRFSFRSVFRTELNDILFRYIRIYWIRNIFFFGICLQNIKSITWIYFHICVDIFTSIPLLNNPVFKSKF